MSNLCPECEKKARMKTCEECKKPYEEPLEIDWIKNNSLPSFKTQPLNNEIFCQSHFMANNPKEL